ncbi:FAD-dependent oxidoreductase [Variovorax sp. ZS18.2.2]|uniref:GcvT family protein n=1 Tax=Variovorax sp. ZS18.2.2 TaxID=2971255 RepID=UPI0021517074|nr:FAD-dependent oxidoreductase [Variovorax sp. ZS18.2.2]MCR6474677.1 FAD-dependent oxidoreductase [Variovorax sp. ZS18.2.2]
MATPLPSHAQVVIAGGGIAGCSAAYHLTKLGCTDVIVLEQGQLTCGTTWHAAGLVGQLRANRSMTKMSRYGIDLYASLEAETGLATGWKQCGSITVARTPERMTLLKRTIATARSFGIEAEFITPTDALELWPLMRIDDLVGAVWLPGDGKANPTDLTQSLAKGARNRGAKVFEGVQITGTIIENGRIVGVETSQGTVRCESFLNCAGQWARELGKMSGVNIPLHSAEHFYLVTKEIEGVHRDLPVLRDPDGYIYYKEEVGGLVMGGFEPVAKPWGMDGIPPKFEFQLLPDDMDQFQILLDEAVHRTPALETTEIKLFLNGPESFTPDGNFILGEAPEVRGYFVAAGFNSAGIANAGGAGKLIAEWIVGGTAPADLLDVDIRRFAPFNSNKRWLKERTVEALGLHYAMRWPRHELESGRPLRRSPLYDRLKAKGAAFGSKLGWERASWFALPDQKAEARYGFGRPDWLDACNAEQMAVRQGVVVFDQTSFGKLMVQGRDAEPLLQRLCANDVAIRPGSMVYTALLNERGGFESDLTVMRLEADCFLIITGSAQPYRDIGHIKRHLQPNEHVTVTDVTSGYCTLTVTGPKAQQLLSRVTPQDLRKEAFPQSAVIEIDVGHARALAAKVSYVGGPGWELYIPTEMAVHVYDTLFEAGADLGLRDGGYYTIDALRIEAGRRAFGLELGPDENPFEAGLEFAVQLDKPVAFIGQAALAKIAPERLAKRLLMFTLNDEQAFAWGGEPILRNGKAVGELTSTAWSAVLGRMVVMGYVRSAEPLTRDEAMQGSYEIDIAGHRFAATAQSRPPYPSLVKAALEQRR